MQNNIGWRVDSQTLNVCVWSFLDVSRRYRRHEGMVDFINFGTVNGNHSASLPGNRDESLEITVGRDE